MPDKKFKFLDHQKNLQLRAFGDNLAELFSNAALAMMTFSYPRQVDFQQYETNEKIELKAENLNNLMVGWLSEIIYLSDSKDCCYSKFNISQIENDEIKAIISGRRAKTKQKITKVISRDIKIKEIATGWVADIVFEI